ncbi:MAG: hypothetical protein FK732_07095 [Asgard group archaeon]|nr:hypothetical protein [Asgard group archaeon]
MPEEIFVKNIDRLEAIYSTLIKGETNPQQEAELRIELIDTLSNLEASIIGEKEHNKEFIELLATVRDIVLDWDPYGHWFRQHENLVDLTYEIIVKAKNVVFTQSPDSSEEASRLKTELASLKSELNDLRALMSSLVKEKAIEVPEEVVEAVRETDSLPPVDEALVSITETQKEPEVTESESEPSIILPIEPETPPVEESVPLTEETPIEQEPEQPVVQETEDSEIIASDSTIQKLSETVSPEEQPSAVLSQMKSIIHEAEEETEKQMADFKEKMQETEATPPIVEKEVKETPPEEVIPPPPIVEEPAEESSGDSWVKPSEILKQKETQETSATTTDPYMQLLTLEAEKYRLEKEIEKNETDFQEGLKSKQDFDISVQRINSELAIVRDQIEELRKQLTS